MVALMDELRCGTRAAIRFIRANCIKNGVFERHFCDEHRHKERRISLLVMKKGTLVRPLFHACGEIGLLVALQVVVAVWW